MYCYYFRHHRAKKAETALREAAEHDPLTGLPNRSLIFEYTRHLLAAANRKHSRGAILFIDLDRFKPVNDQYGHEAGDELLRQVAKRMLACVRQEDMIGRIGGDEFVIVLPTTHKGYSCGRGLVAAVSTRRHQRINFGLDWHQPAPAAWQRCRHLSARSRSGDVLR